MDIKTCKLVRIIKKPLHKFSEIRPLGLLVLEYILYKQLLCGLLYAKRSLKSRVVVMLKRRMGAYSCADPSFGMTPAFRLFFFNLDFFLKSQYHCAVNTRRRMGACDHAHPSFGMTMTQERM